MAILQGEMDLSAWSEEELIRGQRRSRRGTWEGRPPKLVPKAIHDELVRRKMGEAFDLMRDNVVKATEVLIEIAEDKEVDPAVRLRAVGMIHDRVLGKSKERVELALAPDPFLETIDAITVVWGDEVIDVEEANEPFALPAADDD